MSWLYKKHGKGDLNCKACCCGIRKCAKCHTGVIHCSVVDERQVDENNWEWVHNYKCDLCDYEETPEPLFKIIFD